VKNHHPCTLAALCVAAFGAIQAPAIAQQQAPASSVSIYGILDTYAGSMRRSDQPGRTTAINSGGMTTSFLGFRGSEDLGGGARAFFVLESFLQVDTGLAGRTTADPFFSRNSFVGLSNAYGQVTLGRQTNPMYVATGAFNPFQASANLSPVLLHVWSANYNRTVVGDTVWDNSVQYATPGMAGFTGSATYGFGEVADNNGVRNANLTANYTSGPFAAAVSGQQVKVGPGLTAAMGSEKAVMAGASYDLQWLKLYGQYFHTDTRGTALKTKTGQIGVAVPVGTGNIMASVAHTRRDAPNVDAKRTTTGLGYDHFLSKRTDLYAVYLQDKLTGFSSTGSLALGVRHRF
jgi:predicted porin